MRLENRPFNELNVGDTAERRRLLTSDDLYVFAGASGNYNPLHLPHPDEEGQPHVEPVAPAMFIASLVSAVLGMDLPGAGTLYISQTLNFGERAHAGEELCTKVAVTAKDPDGTLTLATEVRRIADGAMMLSGEAKVKAPQEKIVIEDLEVPGLEVQRHRHFEALLEKAKTIPAVPTAVVCPDDENSLGGAVLGAHEGLIVPILIGDRDKISALAAKMGLDISGFELIAETNHLAAAAKACELVNEGRAGAVMKGHLHTDDLLRPMLDKTKGLRMGRRFTHVFVMDVPGMPEPIIVSDAAINISPDLVTKVDIVQNAIDVALSIGMEMPRVGVLSAVETVNPAIQSSLDAALLSKMADRGQITGGLVDGPLAMDNAINLAAARTKGIKSAVAGQAEILIVPDLDAGNMLAKQLSFISHAESAGLVLGAKVPVILNSRADGRMSRLASCAVAALHRARTSA